jgi:dolichol kinase
MKSEIRRQFIHFLFGSFFIAHTAAYGVQQTLLVLSAAFFLGLFLSFLLKKGFRIPLISHVTEKVERDYERHLPGKGALLFFLGAIVTLLLFQDTLVAVGALCVAVYGDAASTVFGLRLGRHKISGKKTLEGTLGGILASVVFLALVFEWRVALAAAVIGMLAELLPGDDNFTIPLAVALTLTILI